MTGQSSAFSNLLYVGSYTQFQGKSQEEGIAILRLDPATSSLTRIGSAGGVVNPSFLALHPTRPVLYAVSETRGGQVCAFSIDSADGSLALVNAQSSHGDAPCHLSVDASGRFVLVANYSSGTIAVLPIAEDGALQPASDVIQHVGSGPNASRQQHAYAHSIWQDPSGRFVLVCDLGCDRVFVYCLDTERGKLMPNDPPAGVARPGSGPRHLDFHPNGKYIYVVDELDSTLTVFGWDGDSGTLSELQVASTLPAGYSGKTTCADVHVSPSGGFVYGSNRGHDSIAAFAIDGSTGLVTAVQYASTQGATPRNFGFGPTGTLLLVANQDSDNVVAFRVDQQSGKLTPTGQSIEVRRAVCLKFAASK